MIITGAPYRVSLLGGGTDTNEWLAKHDGAVLGGAINQGCHILARRLPPYHSYRHRVVYSSMETVPSLADINHRATKACLQRVGWPDEDGVELFHQGDIPGRSGTGSSSSFVVALLHALKTLRGETVSPAELAGMAVDVEQNLLGEAVGRQDQTFAAHGGLNLVRFSRGESAVYPLTVSDARVRELEANLMLFFTRVERNSSDVATGYYKDIPSRARDMYAMVKMAEEGVGVIDRGDWARLGELVDASWRVKAGFAGVCNAEISSLYTLARAHGAIGGKITGAGGGGCLLLVVPPERHESVRLALPTCIHVPFRFSFAGSRVLFFDRGK